MSISLDHFMKEEFDSVGSIYEGFKDITEDSKHPKCKIALHPSNNDTNSNKTFIALHVTFTFTDKYPSDPPTLLFHPTSSMKQTLQTFYHTFKENEDMLSLTKKQHQCLTNAIHQHYKQNDTAEELIFDLICLIQEWIDDNNVAPTNDTFDEKHNKLKTNNEASKQEEKHADNKSKPKILLLHAYKQNGKIFRSRSKNYIKLLQQKFDLSFPNAPIKLNGTHSCPNPYCWYKYPQVTDADDAESNLAALLKSHTMAEYIGFWELIQYFYKYLIDECFESNCAFSGIIAFSQGATLAVILLWISSLSDDLFEKLIILPHLDKVNKIGLYGLFQKYGSVFNKYLKIKGCVLMSGHLYPLPKQLENSYANFVMFCNDKERKEKNEDIEWNKLQCLSLHTMSPNDAWVTMEKSQHLLSLFEKTETIEHANGHSVYNNKYVAEWLMKCLF